MTHDLVVIGAGQGGGPLAVAFARAGRRVALVERAHVGGTCVNVGCTPSKTMVASARVAHLARRGAEYGVRVDEVAVDVARVRERKRAIVQSFRAGSEHSLERAGVEVLSGAARFAAPRVVDVVLPSGVTERLSSELIVIDSGARPFVPAIAGLNAVPYLDSTSIMELGALPEHLVVLGGGPVGLEFAQMFRRFGSRVSVLQRGPQLLAREDADIADAVVEILRSDGIDVFLNAVVTQVARGDGAGVVVTHRPANGAGTSEALLVGDAMFAHPTFAESLNNLFRRLD